MIKPIFDPQAIHVGWHNGIYIFDNQLDWVAFEYQGDLFSSTHATWLGPLVDGTFLDQTGKPVAWLAGTIPTGFRIGTAQPKAPIVPIAPKNLEVPRFPTGAMKQLSPLGGWSKLSWIEWLSQG